MCIYRYLIYITTMLVITCCVTQHQKKIDVHEYTINDQKMDINCSEKKIIYSHSIYEAYIQHCAKNYGIDAALIKAIIQVESNYNPHVVSKSNAIGLMQIKADTAGKDAYRVKGWPGKPSHQDLKNAIINIELGTVYLSILQQQLEGIVDLKTRRYAIIVAYVNGLGALLKIFSVDRICAIERINTLNSEQFYQHIQYNHPSKQAQRYLTKVNSMYDLYK